MKTCVIMRLIVVFFSQNWPVNSKSVLCPPDWKYNRHENQCFHVPKTGDDGKLHTAMDWEAARGLCHPLVQLSDFRSDLVTVTKPVTGKFIRDAMPDDGGEYWTGLKRDENSNWRWSRTGKIQNMTELLGAKSSTPVAGSDSNCLAFQTTFVFRSCTEYKALAVCEIADVDPCRHEMGGCEHFCYNDGLRKKICMCRPGYHVTGRTHCKGILDECDTGSSICEHYCDNRGCACRAGFKLVNSTRCQDIDECAVRNGGCEHICINEAGSFSCSCEGPYKQDSHFYCRYHNARRGREQDSRSIHLNVFMIFSGFLTVVVLVGGTYKVAEEHVELRRTTAQHDLNETRQNSESSVPTQGGGSRMVQKSGSMEKRDGGGGGSQSTSSQKPSGSGNRTDDNRRVNVDKNRSHQSGAKRRLTFGGSKNWVSLVRRVSFTGDNPVSSHNSLALL